MFARVDAIESLSLDAAMTNPLTPSAPSRARPVPALFAVLFLAIWVALGFAMRSAKVRWLDANAYLVLGVPLTLLHQRFVRRRPIPELWVRDSSGPAARRSPLLKVTIFLALAAYPAVMFFSATRAREPAFMAWTMAAIVGAAGCSYAIAYATRRDVRALLGCLLTAGVLGTLLMVAAAMASHANKPPLELGHVAKVFLTSLAQYIPVCFALEEVSMRALVDAEFARSFPRARITTAIVSSALWGLWHLPTVPANAGGAPLGVICVSLMLTHTLIGVPLALWYRRSGNLLVPVTTHAFIDAVRNALVGLPG
jgi:membrane protease YdiL (CAAX protease family)